MEYSFAAKVVLTMEHKHGWSRSKHVATDINLFPSKNLDQSIYLTDELPNKEGSNVLTNVLVQGLVGNIHHAHENGFRDSAEHLRFIISELERGFVEVAEVSQSNF